MADIIDFNVVRALDLDGNPVPGAQAWFYDSGTDTARTVYSDEEGTAPHAQPVVADGEGVFPPVYDTAAGAVRVVLKDADGVVLDGYPLDPAQRIPSVASAADSITFSPTEAVPALNVQSAIEKVQANVEEAGASSTSESKAYTDEINDELREWVNGGYFGSDADGYYIGNVVLLMSSTGAGQGSTNNVSPSKDNDWTSGVNSCAYKLKEIIGTRGTLINRSVGGANMTTKRQYFYDQVAPYHPRFVVLGTGFFNQNGTTGAEKASYWAYELIRLVEMVRNIGAEPIVWAFNPIDNLTETDRLAMRGLKRMCARLGVRVWDMSGSTANSDYSFISTLKYDDLHANDTGHQLYFETVNFADLRATGPLPINAETPRYRLTVTAGNAVPALYASSANDDRAFSWTVYARVYRPDHIDDMQRILVIGAPSTTDAIRVIRSASGYYQVANNSGTLINTTTSASAVGTDEIVVRYHRYYQQLRLYVNGTQIGEYVGLVGERLNDISFGGWLNNSDYPGLGFQLEDLRVWGIPLMGYDIDCLFGGDRPMENLMLDISMQDYTPGAIINRANTPAFRCRMGPTGAWSKI